jgi:Tol biopolymer transport system component/Zn-dependent M28 family amino/carboxypeptidase
LLSAYARLAIVALALGMAVDRSVAEEEAGKLSPLSEVRQLTFEGRRAGEGYFGAEGKRMVFQSERDPANPFYQIYLMDLETGDVEQVSPGVGKTTCAWLHPAGNTVLYASTHEDPAARDKMLAELAFRASGETRRYQWDYDEHYEIYAQDLATGERVNLTNTPGYDAEGAYSPDGSKIVFASNRRAYQAPMSAQDAAMFEHDKSYLMDIYLMDADGGNVRRLTDAPGYDGGPFFSADGRQITWRRFNRKGTEAEIYTMDLESGREKQVTRMGVMSWAPYFHPSGDYIVFASNREGFDNFELFMVDAGGLREPVRVTFSDGFDGLPVFSPDGSRLSWTSNRTSNRQSQIFWGAWDDAAARRLLGIDASGRPVPPSWNEVGLAATHSDIRVDDLRLHVARLTADEMQGRLTGTRGEELATDYVAGAFKHIGLAPAGEEGTWFQTFEFTSGATLGADNRLAVDGVSLPAEPVLDRDWRPLALSGNGEFAPAGVVFAGYGIIAPGAGGVPDYDAYAGLDVTDQWVMVLRFLPESVPAAWRSHLLHYADLAYKAATAKRLGARGLIVVTGPQAAARERLVDLSVDAAGGAGSLAGISIGDDLAARLLQAAGHDLADLQARLDTGETVAGFALDGVRVGARIAVERQLASGRNVIGRLAAGEPNTLPPLVIGAHVDHLGRGQAHGSLAREAERGSVHHGADDNASGVAAMLEIAQHLKELQKRGRLAARRDILFVGWSGEELGTLGSTHFVEGLADGGDLRDVISAYLNLDMIGHLRERLYLQGTGSSSVWAREIERRNVPVGLAIATKADPYLPTDVTPFYLQGVPVLNAFTGAHEDYSTPRDTADRLNYDGMRDIARLVAGIARSLASSVEEPDYVLVERQDTGLSRKHLRAYLGTIPAYGQDESVAGVRLQGAIKGGPAAQAGVVNGDVVVGLAGVEIENIQDFMSALGALAVGEETELTVLRDGGPVVLKVVPGSRQ